MDWLEFGCAPSLAAAPRQPSGLLHPLAALLGPIAAFDALPARQQLPGQSSAFQSRCVKQIEGPVVGEGRIAPLSVSDQHVAREIGGIRACRKKYRLARIVGAAGDSVRQEARWSLVPKHPV